MPIVKKRCARAAPGIMFAQSARLPKICSETLEDNAFVACSLELSNEEESTPPKEESPLLGLVSLQNADGSWALDSSLASLLDQSEAEIKSKMPEQVSPSVWATVLAILWLHSKAAEQREEWELLEAKALNWLQGNAGSWLADCLKTGNAVLGSSVSPQTLGL
ncbi:von Willebrand factor A domain-containing protein 5A-like [Heteronotia binoei]|uniref:von Willebrand factor A domain-containing protein 5A-like n=1 Tax=Heteronotia binoei TaxID=13085 RepID=UPI00292F7B6B|nr:von Willebrand factor A domain-containing protein 5A-like [Heteronotia binoei]